MTLGQRLSQYGTSSTCPVAIIFRDGNVLTGHRHYTKDTWKEISVWTIPGGRCDSGETIEQTLRREIREEVGISEIAIVDFIGEAAGAKEGDIVPIFFCTTSEDARLMEPEKFSEWKWVRIQEYVENTEYAGFNPPARKMIIEYLVKL